MDFLGIEISETATKWTAISTILTTISGVVWAIIERRQKQKLKDAEVRKAKIENVDLVNNFYKELFDHAEILLKYQRDHFSYYIEYCNKNIEDFMKFISDKNEDRDKTNT